MPRLAFQDPSHLVPGPNGTGGNTEDALGGIEEPPAPFPGGSHFPAIPVKRDKLPSIAYSEELIFSLSVTLQSTDRRHGIVGQERCHFQRDS